MARVFSAVDIEDEKVLDELSRVRDHLDLGFNKVSRQKMHLTLQFFKNVDDNDIAVIGETISQIKSDPFSLDIEGLGAFPSEDYIRVLWAGAESDEIHRIYEQVSDHDVAADNNHEFHPHITISRVKNISPEKKKKLRKSIEEFRNHDFGEIEVDRVKLFESHLTGKASKYEVIKEVKL